MSPCRLQPSWFVQLAATAATLHKSHSVSDRSQGEAELTHPHAPIVRTERRRGAELTAKRAIRRAMAMLVVARA